MMDSSPLRTIVVDDEQLARDELCFLLGQLGEVEVVAQAGNGIEALKVVEEAAPDLIMLDVQMPGLTGFEVARRLVRAGLEAQFIFVTAYDQHAIEAFEVNAVDYLLKPVEAGRLATAVDRARRRIQTDRNGSCSSWPVGRSAANSSRSRSPTGSCWFNRTKSFTPRSKTMSSRL
jgi:DNA-binding LytR/AlgR family response regulator